MTISMSSKICYASNAMPEPRNKTGSEQPALQAGARDSTISSMVGGLRWVVWSFFSLTDQMEAYKNNIIVCYSILSNIVKAMTIQSVDRALHILQHFSLSRTALGIGELSHLMNLPRATVHGLVRTLVNNGFLRQDPETRKYLLGFKIYELGTILTSTLEINRKANDHAHSLAKKTRLDARISVWDVDSALLTLGVSGRSLPFFQWIGPRLPAYCSASGRAMLAHFEKTAVEDYFGRANLVPYTSGTITDRDKILEQLDITRQRGFSMEREELIQGLVAIGAPIFDQGGLLIAAISLSGDKDRFLKKELKMLGRELVHAATMISRGMGYYPEEFRGSASH